MAVPGRKPKPPQLKILEGNPGKRPIPEPLAVDDGARPLRMPANLPPAARREWRRVAPVLQRMRLATQLDRTALADYCLCVARLEAAEADIAERGILVPGERGMVKNPALQAAREYRSAIVRWCAEFGLTPSARGRMTLPETPDEDDPFAGLVD